RPTAAATGRSRTPSGCLPGSLRFPSSEECLRDIDAVPDFQDDVGLLSLADRLEVDLHDFLAAAAGAAPDQDDPLLGGPFAQAPGGGDRLEEVDRKSVV